jgi:hypothetical protein
MNEQFRQRIAHLEGLLKSVEWKGDDGAGTSFCIFCGMNKKYKNHHKCPAFEPDGTIK